MQRVWKHMSLAPTAFMQYDGRRCMTMMIMKICDIIKKMETLLKLRAMYPDT